MLSGLQGTWALCNVLHWAVLLPRWPAGGTGRILLATGTGVINASLRFSGECSVTGQSHFKSFDNKYFTFSGICQYLFAKDCVENSFSVIIETVQVTAASAHALERAGRAAGA